MAAGRPRRPRALASVASRMQWRGGLTLNSVLPPQGRGAGQPGGCDDACAASARVSRAPR